MTKLRYLDKRNERGVILYYSAQELAYEVTHKAFEFIKASKVYNLLKKTLPDKYVDLYYLKMIYQAFLPIAHQLVIYKHDKQHYGKAPVNRIDTSGFPCQFLLREIWIDNSIDFSISYFTQIKDRTKETLYPILKGNNSLINLFKLNTSNNVELSNSLTANIALNYQEGFDVNKRSDIFWLRDSGIDPKSVIVYYENPYTMTRHDNEQTSELVFHKNGVRQVKLWEWLQTDQKKYFNDLVVSLKSLHIANKFEQWLRKSAYHLCKKTSIWVSFFEHHGIKIHLDPIEWGLETICKQIAINTLGGCSVGKVRSYPINLKGEFLGFFPNDVFFTWGRDSSKKINSSNQNIPNILISGLPYNSTIIKHNNDATALESRLKLNGTKFNILFLDTNHGPNDGLIQLVETNVMLSLYKAILNLVKVDNEIGLIIKPKKSHFLESLPGIIDYIDEIEKKTHRCYLVRDPFQKMPSSYLKGIDMVVGIFAFLPASVIECVIHGARCIIYDYPNLRLHEPDLYKWGENKVIFSDPDKMISDVQKYKNNPSNNPGLGDWSECIDELDRFRDNLGGERIGNYMRWLQEGFDGGLKRDAVIDRANGLYAEAWDADKIYCSERPIQSF